MRQRIDAGDGEREVGIVLVGKTKALRFDTEPEKRGVAVEGFTCRRNGEAGYLRLCVRTEL
jgi:hypothetical protein